MPTPLPHQIIGAKFLSDRTTALLADAPRVGKTGAAIMAADDILARKILVVTTASGRPVWARAFAEWAHMSRKVVAHYSGPLTQEARDADVLIVGWSMLDKVPTEALWHIVIIDESHYAKSIEAKRTQHLYGQFKGTNRSSGIVDRAERVWCLTGTPIPNAPNDLYPMLKALRPDAVEGFTYDAFLHRYCIVRRKAISRWTKIDVVVGGRNEDELRERMNGFWLRRTQEDVGITKPVYEILPIHVGERQRRALEAELPEFEDILAAAETGETKSLDMHLGTLRRLTGSIKAEGVIQAVKDELEGNDEKIVLMAWHKDTIAALAAGLSRFGVCVVTGDTSPRHRQEAEARFNAAHRVFIGQIIACGEAIDLSAASDLIFVESSFVPKDMTQAALRITNVNQKRQPRVRVAALEGSIDEALQSILIRKIATNKEVMK